MISKRSLMIITLMSISGLSYSANETLTEKRITQINSYADYAVIYYTPSSIHTQSDCLVSKSRAIIEYEDGVSTNKEMYSLALTAATAGKTVNLAVSGCYGAHPKIYRVDVKFE